LEIVSLTLFLPLVRKTACESGRIKFQKLFVFRRLKRFLQRYKALQAQKTGNKAGGDRFLEILKRLGFASGNRI
jgi:hypothetical protein